MAYRHEYKHVLNTADAQVLRMRLEKALRHDSHAGSDGRYHIRSLYFDNYRDKALREKINGVDGREKFRLRYYNGDASYILLEKKSKRGSLSEKRSVRLTRPEVQRILEGDCGWMITDSRALLVELYSKQQSQLLRPATVVDYIREPFVYPAGNVRITLDSDIRTGIRSTDFFNPSLPTVPAQSAILLEVKYDGFLPDIVRALLQLQSRRETAFSKYAACRMYD